MTSVETRALGATVVAPGFVRLQRRAPSVPLEPEVRSPEHVRAALARFAKGLEDEQWQVTVGDEALFATKHPGLRYRMRSLIDRLTRGELACWRDGDSLRVEFRPDWPRMLVDMVLVGMLYRWFRDPWGPHLALEIVIFAALFTLVYAASLPFLRARFLLVLSRAVWLDDDQWRAARGRADTRRRVVGWIRRAAIAWLAWRWWTIFGKGAWWMTTLLFAKAPLLAAPYAASALLALVVALL